MIFSFYLHRANFAIYWFLLKVLSLIIYLVSYKVVFGEHCLAGGAAGAIKSEELHSSVQMSYYPYTLSNACYS